MIKKSKFFKFCSGICFLLIIILISTPLVTLAFEQAEALDTPAISTNALPIQPIEPSKHFIITETFPDPPIDLPLYDKYSYEERKSQGLSTQLPTVEPYYGEKVIYLTFDDGPDPNNTPEVLKILNHYNVKATFFVVGLMVERHPEILQQLYDEGHAIGNHSYNHIYRELYQSASTYFAQLHHNDDIIKNVIGVRPRISRAPGGTVGSFTKEYWNQEKQQGYMDISWNISSGDAAASSVSAESLLANIIQQTENKALWSHAILLMHDGVGHSETVKALPQIIEHFKNLGFEFKVITPKTPPAW